MKWPSAILTAGLFVLTLSDGASAQGADAAMNEAKARLACGAGTVVASQYLPGGSLQVTCSRAPLESSSALAQGTGLAAPATAGLVATLTIITVLLGSNGSGTTTTSTSGQVLD